MRAPPAADGTRRRRIAAVVSLACVLACAAAPARASARDAQVTAAAGAPQAATAAPEPAPSPAAAIVPPPGVSAARVAPVRRPPIPLAAAVREVSPPARIAPPPIPAPLAGSATESEALRRYVRGKQRLLDGQLNRAIDDIDAALRLDPGAPELRAAR